MIERIDLFAIYTDMNKTITTTRDELRRLAKNWLEDEWGDKDDGDTFDKKLGALHDFIDDLFREDEPDSKIAK